MLRIYFLRMNALFIRASKRFACSANAQFIAWTNIQIFVDIYRRFGTVGFKRLSNILIFVKYMLCDLV